MRAVHIGIGHDDDLVIAKLGNVKILSVPFGKAAAEGVDHGLDLCIGQHLIHGGLLYIENLAPDGENGLEHPVSCHLGRAAGGITLNDKDLALGRIPGFAVGELSVGVKGKLRPHQHIRLGLGFRLADLRCPLGAFNHGLELLQIPVKIVRRLVRCHLGNRLGGIRIVQLGLGLTLETGIRVLDRNDGRHAVSHIGAGIIDVLFLERSQLSCVAVDDLSEGRFKASQVRAAFGIVNIVAKAHDLLPEITDVLKGALNLYVLVLSAEIDDVRHGLIGLIQLADEPGNAVRLVVNLLLLGARPLILIDNGEPGI